MCNCDSSNNYDKSCAAISFHEVTDVALKGINITVRTTNTSGIVFWHASNISVQSTRVYSYSNNTCAFGILISHAETVHVSSVSAYKFSIGFVLQNASNIRIISTVTRKKHHDGMYFEKLSNVHITDTTTTHNGGLESFYINYYFEQNNYSTQ